MRAAVAAGARLRFQRAAAGSEVGANGALRCGRAGLTGRDTAQDRCCTPGQPSDPLLPTSHMPPAPGSRCTSVQHTPSQHVSCSPVRPAAVVVANVFGPPDLHSRCSPAQHGQQPAWCAGPQCSTCAAAALWSSCTPIHTANHNRVTRHGSRRSSIPCCAHTPAPCPEAELPPGYARVRHPSCRQMCRVGGNSQPDCG